MVRMPRCFLAMGVAAVSASFAYAEPQWFLMARHGECMDVASLKRRIPDLGDVRDPAVFAKVMQGKGHQVTMIDVPMPKGKAVEVRVPARELALIFVTSEVCAQAEGR